jgi:CheY-like chemotaxis protein
MNQDFFNRLLHLLEDRIDDEPDVQAVVRGCLEDIGGWEVISAASGREGLVQMMAHSPDAIVLDMMMPEMDGLAFLKALNTNPLLCPTPVVFLTAKVFNRLLSATKVPVKLNFVFK